MKFLIRLLVIFLSAKLILSKPQNLQEQTQLDPINETHELLSRDPGKRTIGLSHHYALGKHIGVNPRGVKYLLGYSPINVKYVPVIKPVTILKPVLQQNIKQLWKPMIAPSRQYLPFHKPAQPFNQVEQEWKPMIPIMKPVHEHVAPEMFQIAVKPLVHNVVPIKPPVPNYFYFQTPVAHPNLIPHPQFFHVKRPQLPVLPLGATFPAPVLQHPVHPQLLVPQHFYQPEALPPQQFQPNFEQTPHYPPPVEFPGHHPFLQFHNQHFVPSHSHQPIPEMHNHIAPEIPQQGYPQQVLPYPGSAEFHGNHHLLQLHNQHFLPSHPQHGTEQVYPQTNHQLLQLHHQNFHPSPQQQFSEAPNLDSQTPVENEQHAEEQYHYNQAPFNPEAAIQPGHTDLQLPLYLPNHPNLHQNYDLHYLQQQAAENQLPSFQNNHMVLRPSNLLEPPLHHEHGN